VATLHMVLEGAVQHKQYEWTWSMGNLLIFMLLKHRGPCILSSHFEMWTVATPLSVTNTHC